jgi:hypothetical protein
LQVFFLLLLVVGDDDEHEAVVVASDDGDEEEFEGEVELLADVGVVAEIGEFAVYCTDDFDVAVLDQFQVLLLVCFRTVGYLLQQVAVEFAVGVFVPVLQVEVAAVLIR